MNSSMVNIEYGSEIADFVTEQVERLMGQSGYDLYVSDGLPISMIDKLISDYFCFKC